MNMCDMSHMQEISIRELHRRTEKWVRETRRHGTIVVSDRNVTVAKLMPIDALSAGFRAGGFTPTTGMCWGACP
jgi:antitoxin (DNA-binding transcriptional repressor) of toxin-antitoxin stability system